MVSRHELRWMPKDGIVAVRVEVCGALSEWKVLWPYRGARVWIREEDARFAAGFQSLLPAILASLKVYRPEVEEVLLY